MSYSNGRFWIIALPKKVKKKKSGATPFAIPEATPKITCIIYVNSQQ
jgi:hypothetical protein